MATLKDISRQLGLSVTQVSRALNGHSDVNADTRRRVEEAARDMDYRPNLTARKLARGHSGIVALVQPNSAGLPSERHFFEAITGLSMQFAAIDMQFMLHVTPPGDDVIAVYDKLDRAGLLDGFVLLDPTPNDARVAYLSQRNVPFVIHGRTLTGDDYPYFDIDNVGVSRELTEHLLALGHRRIALVNGVADRGYAQARLAGYREALTAAGIDVDPALVRHDVMTIEHGMLSTLSLFDPARGADRDACPTAVICGNTLIADGVYRALESLGLSIPADVSVVAHDDDLSQLSASAFRPALTSTRSPLRDSWEPLARFLRGAIQKEPLAALQHVEASTFETGHSSASPRQRQSRQA